MQFTDARRRVAPVGLLLLTALLAATAALQWGCETTGGIPGGAATASRFHGGAAARDAGTDAPGLGVQRPALREEVWVIAKAQDDAAPDAPQVGGVTATQGTLVAPRTDDAGRTTLIPVPLEHTDVKASISAYIAAVDVTQRFHNPFDTKIEAVYVFPLPHDAAVNEFVMTIGDRRIRGLIREREEAQRVYDAAKQQGYVASLLTQERPNIFTQKVANLEPGKTIDVAIRYYHTLAYDDGWYEFVFPMVVGPRYNPPGGTEGIGAAGRGAAGASGQPKEVQYLRPTERSGHDIALAVDLDAGVPIEQLRSVNHEITATPRDPAADRPTHLGVALATSDAIPNKDFVLRWRVAGDRLKTAVTLHRDDRGGYFSMVLYPPAELSSLQREPLELVFLVDVSGSMSGKPIAKVKDAMRAMLTRLDNRDTFQVITFAGAAEAFTDQPVPVTEGNLRRALDRLDKMGAGGGTEMLKGIRRAMQDSDPHRRRFVALMTDGYIGNETHIIDAVRHAPPGVRFFAFGVGSSVNRYLIEGVARAGRGAAAFVALSDDPADATGRYLNRVSHPALTDIAFDFGTMHVTQMYPSRLTDVYVGRPVVVTGRFEGQPPAAIKITGRAGGQTLTGTVPVPPIAGTPAERALAALWARATIAELIDFAPAEQRAAVVNQVRRLALDYSLMSDFTAFVAVDASRVTDGDSGVTVHVPVPVPDGVRYETTVSER